VLRTKVWTSSLPTLASFKMSLILTSVEDSSKNPRDASLSGFAHLGPATLHAERTFVQWRFHVRLGLCAGIKVLAYLRGCARYLAALLVDQVGNSG
jgi:hypothetical protein